MKVLNSSGKIWYGCHFYPGVAEYREANGDPYRIFINEDTIRSMSPSFAGKPIFIDHVDQVDPDIEQVKNEADGWVVESFFNPADGKTWVKFITVSKKAEDAIRQKGYRLSNAYIPKSFGPGGLWNGVDYKKEVLAAEYEHLAIVKDPRYESDILSPEEFKEYNKSKELELLKIANSKDQKEKSKMKFSFFKKAKVENSADLEGMCVILPKSGKEITIEKLINEADEVEMADEVMANGEHKVMVGEEKMSVNDLLSKHKAMNDELDLLKEKKPADKEGAKQPDIKSMDNDEDEEAKKKALELAEHEEKEILEKKKNEEDEKKKEEEKKHNAAEGKKHFDALKNAHLTAPKPVVKVDLSEDKVARGKSRYGSN